MILVPSDKVDTVEAERAGGGVANEETLLSIGLVEATGTDSR